MADKRPPRRITPVHNTWKYARSNLLTVLTLASILLGVTFGVILRNSKDDRWSPREQAYVKFGGEIFLRMLKALTIPLIISSVIAALGSLDLRLSGKIGVRTGLFYLASSVCAVILGVLLVVTIRPGIHNNDKLEPPMQIKLRKVLTADVMMDIGRNLFPSNLFQATLNQYETIMDMPSLEKMKERLAANETIDDSAVPTKSRTTEGANTLGLILYSTLFGLALSSFGTYGKPVLKFFRCFSQIMLVVSSWILWLAPMGIFCLLTAQILEIGDVHDIFVQTRMYVFTVLFGLLTHGLVVLPILYFIVSGSHPFDVIGRATHALVNAFGTSSSTASLPATIACMEDKNRVDPRVARFVLPIGAVLNMDGTALYEAVAALFLAQLHGISLDLGSIISVSLIIIIASIGASGIPHAGIVTLSMLMNLLGLPAESIAFIIPVDFVLHRFRTTINVLGDVIGASLVDKLCKEELEKVQIDSSVSSKDLSRATSTEEV